MKFALSQYTPAVKDNEAMLGKKESLARKLPPRKSVHLTYVTTFGLAHNEYWNNVQCEVTLDDLFQE